MSSCAEWRFGSWAGSRRASAPAVTSTSPATHLAGWELGYRPRAVVHHRHRESLASLLGAVVRYGAGARWLNERYPGSSPRWPLRTGLRGAARDVAHAAIRGHWERALYRGIDGLGLIGHNVGYLGRGNEVTKRVH